MVEREESWNWPAIGEDASIEDTDEDDEVGEAWEEVSCWWNEEVEDVDRLALPLEAGWEKGCFWLSIQHETTQNTGIVVSQKAYGVMLNVVTRVWQKCIAVSQRHLSDSVCKAYILPNSSATAHHRQLKATCNSNVKQAPAV